MAAFLPQIPQPGDFLDTTSQPQLLSNNQALDLRFGVDHYKFSDTTGKSGKHLQSTYPELLVDPITLVDEGAIYTKEALGVTQAFWRNENNGIVNQITGIFSAIGVLGPPPTFSGQTALFGGMILQWGNVSMASTASTPVVFTTPFPTACFGVLATPNSVSIAFQSTAMALYPTTTGFNMRCSSGIFPLNVFWIAVGN